MIMLRLNLRCYEQLAGSLVVLGVAGALFGCGAPEGSSRAVPEPSARVVSESSLHAAPDRLMRAAPGELGVPEAIAPQIASASASLVVSPRLPKVEPSPFELVGTSISGKNTFAVLKEADQRSLTVHEGDRVDGYTIASIAPDRVKVRSPDNNEQLLMLLAATGNAAGSTTHTAAAKSEPAANAALSAGGINTDQSIPEHVMLGPTARWPAGVSDRSH